MEHRNRKDVMSVAHGKYFEVGDTVNYHSIIGGPVTSTGHTIRLICMEPNDFGCNVAWVTGISGCVAIEALSNEQKPAPPPKPKMTKSQQRYANYLSCDYLDGDQGFGWFIKSGYYKEFEPGGECV
jgi:hypothetical protein